MITALQLLKQQLKDAHGTFESTAADIKKSHIHKQPGGRALPLGAAYAHLVFSEDMIVHNMLQQKKALFISTWKDKTGASDPLPPFDKNWEKNHTKWASSVKIDLIQMHKYAKAVYKDTDKYLSSLKPKDLEKEIDLGAMGKRTLANIISNFLIAHTDNLAGEISAIKGVFGAKGYQF